MRHMVGDSNSSVRPDHLGWKGKPAQALTEFALVLPVLLIILFGIIEGGRLIWLYSTISAAGREAARYAAGIGDVSGSTALYNDCAGIRAAAVRIGHLAGVTANDVTISFDNGYSVTTYCTSSSDTISNVKSGDRVIIKVDTQYSPLAPIIPDPQMTLHSQSAHTLLTNVPVTAATPETINVAQTCDNTKFSVSNEAPDPPVGPSQAVTIQNNSSAGVTITNLLVIWDTTSNPVLSSITGVNGLCNASGGTSGPYCSSNVSWSFPAGSSKDITLVFSRILKNGVIIRFTYQDGSDTCSFGK